MPSSAYQAKPSILDHKTRIMKPDFLLRHREVLPGGEFGCLAGLELHHILGLLSGMLTRWLCVWNCLRNSLRRWVSTESP